LGTWGTAGGGWGFKWDGGFGFLAVKKKNRPSECGRFHFFFNPVFCWAFRLISRGRIWANGGRKAPKNWKRSLGWGKKLHTSTARFCVCVFAFWIAAE